MCKARTRTPLSKPLTARHVARQCGLTGLLLPLPPYSLQAIPQVATAPVLVLVGAMMMGESTHIDWSSMLTAIPAFLTIVIQPFTFSIANGIYAGADCCSPSAGAAAAKAPRFFLSACACKQTWHAARLLLAAAGCICNCCTYIGTAAPTAQASSTILHKYPGFSFVESPTANSNVPQAW